jgi:hypothetical protein
MIFQSPLDLRKESQMGPRKKKERGRAVPFKTPGRIDNFSKTHKNEIKKLY